MKNKYELEVANDELMERECQLYEEADLCFDGAKVSDLLEVKKTKDDAKVFLAEYFESNIGFDYYPFDAADPEMVKKYIEEFKSRFIRFGLIDWSLSNIESAKEDLEENYNMENYSNLSEALEAVRKEQGTISDFQIKALAQMY